MCAIRRFNKSASNCPGSYERRFDLFRRFAQGAFCLIYVVIIPLVNYYNIVFLGFMMLVAPDSKSDKDLNPGSRSLGSVGDIPPQRGRPTSESIA